MTDFALALRLEDLEMASPARIFGKVNPSNPKPPTLIACRRENAAWKKLSQAYDRRAFIALRIASLASGSKEEIAHFRRRTKIDYFPAKEGKLTTRETGS